ncbi:MAG: HAMP domain-containing sensor histidine kinase [Candidatus Kapaibacterium sp.]|nr:HAMP domain-containing histidine kinase [Ignavibacteriota bacterium]MCB9220222.1 HAMP domain-containing histidine kinase [Ignavibacteria bacterium]
MKFLEKIDFHKIAIMPAFRWQFKLALIFIALLTVIVIIFQTQIVVQDIIEKERNLIKSYSKILESLEDPNFENIEFSLLLNDQILPNISFPMILTDDKNEPLFPFENNIRNIEIDSTKSLSVQREMLKKQIIDMAQTYDPIVIKDHNGKVLSKIYYNNSDLVTALQLYPILAVIGVIVLLTIGYIIFSSVRRNEESKVWVGMSKEAAHQLGTPLSSLLAWMEILRLNIDEPRAISETLSEMDNDVNRMKTIANRFSKIGSKPELDNEHIFYVIDSACNYVEKRLPHLGRKVEIIRDFPKEKVVVEMNVDLFTWVMENLIKNAAESIEEDNGRIRVSMRVTGKKVIIFVKDNGKGMTNSLKKQIFIPGFTTKKRGWGLGLSLSKRIIEDYHKGRIWVEDTFPGKGTTFGIEIPVITSN